MNQCGSRVSGSAVEIPEKKVGRSEDRTLMPSGGSIPRNPKKVITSQHARVFGDRTTKRGCGDGAMSRCEGGKGETAAETRCQRIRRERENNSITELCISITSLLPRKKACSEGKAKSKFSRKKKEIG